MNAVAKVKEDVTEVELDNPSAPPAGNPTPIAVRMETGPLPRPPSRSAAAAR